MTYVGGVLVTHRCTAAEARHHGAQTVDVAHGDNGDGSWQVIGVFPDRTAAIVALGREPDRIEACFCSAHARVDEARS